MFILRRGGGGYNVCNRGVSMFIMVGGHNVGTGVCLCLY